MSSEIRYQQGRPLKKREKRNIDIDVSQNDDDLRSLWHWCTVRTVSQLIGWYNELVIVHPCLHSISHGQSVVKCISVQKPNESIASNE